MNKYTESAAAGAFFGVIVAFIINWIIVRFAMVVGVVLAIIFTGYCIAPLWNDDINISQMREIVDTERVISYSKIDGRIFYALENPTRFLLKNTKLTCGNKTVDLGSVGPHAEYVPIEGFSVTGRPCDITYDPVEVDKHRSNNSITSTVTKTED